MMAELFGHQLLYVRNHPSGIVPGKMEDDSGFEV